ncbi:LPS export ABC transporter periplasmic protein LptC [Primorskyibacter sp. S187A]|uniref:LPS export ABC transporter periplasmic protein LptC n=1 Tax=Primorskyibacter sp. S187A TaxID=3415130 RepID=UPI003C7E9361
MATLFLFARTSPEDGQLPYLEDLRQRVAGADGMRSPFYTGSTEAGDAITVEAESARPDPEDPARTLAQELRAHIGYSDGSDLTITSRDAVYSDATDLLRLSGDVTLISSNGYQVRTELLEAHIEEAFAESPGPVEAIGPAGRITSGGMVVERTGRQSDEVQLVFTKGVKLVYKRETANE